MKTVVALLMMALLSVVAAEPEPDPEPVDAEYPNGFCGCMPDYTFCANDLKTYTSICQYKCYHPGFHDWYIVHDGPCENSDPTNG